MSSAGTAIPRLSIVVPVLNEAAGIETCLEALQDWRGSAEIIVVDGGSEDETAALAAAGSDQLITSGAGRARQMNAGAGASRGEYLVFLHCDTRLGIEPGAMLRVLDRAPAWGFFRVRLSGGAAVFRVIEQAMSLRSQLTMVATGDQCLFVSRSLWEACGGFAEIPLMEDVELCKRLRRSAPPTVVSPPVVTSSRRWEQRGVARTVLLMWQLRLRYWLGADPQQLARLYRG